MLETTTFYELLLRGDLNGDLAGMHYQQRTVYRDAAGAVITERILDPEPVTAGSARLSEILPALNVAAVAQVATLTARLETAAVAIKTAQDDDASKTETIANLQAQIAALTAPAPEPDLLSSLNEAFAKAVPEAMRGAFAQPYAIVRILVQAGQIDMARSVIEAIEVPPDLAAAKAELLTALER